MRSIYVPVPEGTVERLRELAERNLRTPKAQAAWLILDGLARAGLPVGDPPMTVTVDLEDNPTLVGWVMNDE